MYSGAVHDPHPRSNHPNCGNENPVAESSELSRIGPGFVGQSEADLLRREAYAYLDSTVPAGGDVAPLSQFGLHPPVILMQGEGPFVISTDSQKEIVARLNWKSLLYIWGGRSRLCGGFGKYSTARECCDCFEDSAGSRWLTAKDWRRGCGSVSISGFVASYCP